MHKAERDLRRELLRFAKIYWLEIPQAGLRFFFRKVPGVGEDDAAEINRCWCCVDRPAKPLLHQARNPPAVVQVRMRKNEVLNIIGREGQVLPIPLTPFLLTLEQAAVDQHLRSILARQVITGIDQVFRSGHGSGGAKKLNVSQVTSSIESFNH